MKKLDINDFDHKIIIKVVGVGGGGTAAVNNMINAGVKGVEFITVDSDLSRSLASLNINLGNKDTNIDSESSAMADDEHCEEILYSLQGSDMVFVIAGMGGATGTGAAPIVAKCAKKIGALTIGVVTCPFSYGDSMQSKHATQGLEDLRRIADNIIVIPNEKVFANLDRSTSFADAFKVVDDVICQGVQSICDLISDSGYVNVDFADIENIIYNSGLASIGIGEAVGTNAPLIALREAISSPLMEIPVCDSKGIIINFMGEASHLNLMELNVAVQSIVGEAHPDANILWGVSVDDNMDDIIRVVVVATNH